MQEIITKILELKERLTKAWQVIQLDDKKKQVIELQHAMSVPGFWNDQEKAKIISQKASDLETEVEEWEKFKKDLQDLLEITELDKTDQEVNLKEEAETQFAKLAKSFEKMEFALLFKGKYDRGNALVAIHAGAGGTDAQDWAEMLLRMYLRFIEKQGWQAEILSLSSGSEAGLKSVLFQVTGKNSYGYLQAENGVHRLVRISPFDAEKMRHTSFALVEVLPFVEDEIEIEIKSEDLKVDTFRASGNGGQGVNTTDSAVRITHLPTKIIVSCQNERSQAQNREKALSVLKSKLQQYYEAEKEEEKQKLRGEYTEVAWGNQARSYVLHPYKMVKDHRTGFEVTEAENVLDGDILEFIEAYLRYKVK